MILYVCVETNARAYEVHTRPVGERARIYYYYFFIYFFFPPPDRGSRTPRRTAAHAVAAHAEPAGQLQRDQPSAGRLPGAPSAPGESSLSRSPGDADSPTCTRRPAARGAPPIARQRLTSVFRRRSVHAPCRRARFNKRLRVRACEGGGSGFSRRFFSLFRTFSYRLRGDGAGEGVERFLGYVATDP